MLQDIRLALRRMVRNPLFALSAAGTLAIGIAATTSIYSVVDGVLLKPLPFPNPDALVQVSADYTAIGQRDVPLSQPEVDRILKTGQSAGGERARTTIEYSLGESVKVTSGPLSDFDGEIVDVNDGFPEPVPVQVGWLCLRLLPAAELTGALAAMPVARLVERRADAKDRRAVLLTLTPTGRRRARAMRRDLLAAAHELLEPLPEERRAAVAAALEELQVLLPQHSARR